MDVSEAIERRKSIRKYARYEMREQEIGKLVRAAQVAPSAKNLQPCRFVVVKEPALKEKVARACNEQMFMAQASIIICGIVNENISRWTTLDTGIAMEHIALQATEMGLGTCWIGAFDEGAVKEVLKIPEYLRVVALMPVGRSAEEPGRRPRKEPREFVFREEYGKGR